MTNPLSIRQRAVLAEQERVANAKLSLVPHDTDHDINVHVESGSSLDDHRTESGYCETCHLWVNRTYDLRNGDVSDTLMSVEQRAVLEQRVSDNYDPTDAELGWDDVEVPFARNH